MISIVQKKPIGTSHFLQILLLLQQFQMSYRAIDHSLLCIHVPYMYNYNIELEEESRLLIT